MFRKKFEYYYNIKVLLIFIDKRKILNASKGCKQRVRERKKSNEAN